ncbi:MAG: 50S ribosomal protein L11 methyltransferase [Gammaproteobacteria bacterium]
MNTTPTEPSAPAPWLQLAVIATPTDAEQIEAILLAADAMAVSLEDEQDEARFETQPGCATLWTSTRVVGLFPPGSDLEAVLATLQQALGRENPPPYRISQLPEQDWERVWLERFQPMRFGRRLWICPGDHPPPDPAGVNIFLDPGLAFGTGTHPTTALCLEWLEGAALAGATVLDYGCGSGILAVAAARLGARQVWAVDIDPQALEATAANAAKNEVAECIHTALPQDLPAMTVDCVVANILARPLQALAPRLATHLGAGAPLVLSGILTEQADEVMTAYRPWFENFQVTHQEEWIRITAIKFREKIQDTR